MRAAGRAVPVSVRVRQQRGADHLGAVAPAWDERGREQHMRGIAGATARASWAQRPCAVPGTDLPFARVSPRTQRPVAARTPQPASGEIGLDFCAGGGDRQHEIWGAHASLSEKAHRLGQRAEGAVGVGRSSTPGPQSSNDSAMTRRITWMALPACCRAVRSGGCWPLDGRAGRHHHDDGAARPAILKLVITVDGAAGPSHHHPACRSTAGATASTHLATARTTASRPCSCMRAAP